MTTAYMCRCFVNKETTYFSSCDINDIKLPKRHSELGYLSLLLFHFYYFLFRGHFHVNFYQALLLFCTFVLSAKTRAAANE